jgi:hypothetical protein
MAATFTKLPSGVVKATIDGRILYLKPQMSNASIYDATRIRLELQTFAPKEDLFFLLDTSEVTLPAGPWASPEALCDELNTNYFFDTAGGGAPSSELVANSLTLDPAAAPTAAGGAPPPSLAPPPTPTPAGAGVSAGSCAAKPPPQVHPRPPAHPSPLPPPLPRTRSPSPGTHTAALPASIQSW